MRGRRRAAGGRTTYVRGPVSIPGAEVMPWDASIYSTMSEGAVYIFADPYVTIDGNGRVSVVQNAANPGTRDMVFSDTPTVGYAESQRPIWHSSGGLNDRSYASFSGQGQKGIATGFDFDPSDGSNEVALQAVGRWPSVANMAGHGALVLSADNQSWMGTLHLRTDDTFDTWRTNGDITTPVHNLDYGTPEASNDVGWHLHEGYGKATGLLAWLDGTQYGPGGTGGPRPGFGPLINVHIGGGSPNGFGSYATCDVHELVVTEGRDLSQLAAYRTLRIEPLYGLELA